MVKKRTVYVVLCQAWAYNDENYEGDDTPIKAFARKEEAEAYRERCQSALGQAQDDGGTAFMVMSMEMPEG